MFLGAALLFVATPGAAQTPPPVQGGDTVRVLPDTIPAPRDTLAAPTDTVPEAPADTLKPVKVVVPFPTSGQAPAWSAGVWEWKREDLMRANALTLTDLLEQIPGMTSIRSGFYGHAEAATVAGGGGGSVEIVLDGFALDPLGSANYDLGRLELVQLNRVRVQRRGDAVRVELETVAPADNRTYSLVEAGTGDRGAKLFRGTFLAPHVLAGPLSLGVERLDGDGYQGSGPANAFTGWLKWGLVRGNNALQFELRRNSIERTDDQNVTMDGVRRDWVLRARSRPLQGLTAEAFFGSSSLEDHLADTTSAGRGFQGGGRLGYLGEHGWGSLTLRARNNALMPGLEAVGEAGTQLGRILGVSGNVTWADWRHGARATSYGARAEGGPLLPIRPFVEWSSGTRGVPGLVREEGEAVLTDRDVLRLGGEFAWKGARLGAARIRLSADSVADFGLPFDRTARLYAGGTANGWEVSGHVPLFSSPFALQGWYTRWDAATPWIYLPAQSWRAALVYHHLPLPSGNLEITGRLEAHRRGAMAIPDATSGLIGVPGLTALDLDLQIRILDVRAFIRWNNITHQLLQYDLPGRYFPGQRVFYGVKWQFWN